MAILRPPWLHKPLSGQTLLMWTSDWGTYTALTSSLHMSRRGLAWAYRGKKGKKRIVSTSFETMSQNVPGCNRWLTWELIGTCPGVLRASFLGGWCHETLGIDLLGISFWYSLGCMTFPRTQATASLKKKKKKRIPWFKRLFFFPNQVTFFPNYAWFILFQFSKTSYVRLCV